MAWPQFGVMLGIFITLVIFILRRLQFEWASVFLALGFFLAVFAFFLN